MGLLLAYVIKQEAPDNVLLIIMMTTKTTQITQKLLPKTHIPDNIQIFLLKNSVDTGTLRWSYLRRDVNYTATHSLYTARASCNPSH